MRGPIDPFLPVPVPPPPHRPTPWGRGEPPEVEVRLNLDLWVRIATDACPASGEDGPAAILGAWADQWPVDEGARRARAVAVASLAMAADPGAGRAPVIGWRSSRPRPPRRLREASIEVAKAPWWPWRLVESRGGERWRIEGMAAWPSQSWPQEPVDLSGWGSVDGEPSPGRVVLARLVRAPDGWWGAMPLLLPRGSERLVGGAVRSVAALFDGDRTTQDALAAAGHRVAGLLHEACPPR